MRQAGTFASDFISSETAKSKGNEAFEFHAAQAEKADESI
jgi:hypothetical protein